MFTELIADVKIKPLWSRICNYNQELKEHSKHVCDLTYAVCRELDYSESAIKDIVMGALLHDIGKIYIEHDVLEKRGPLTGDEYEQIMKHPLMGAELLEGQGFSDVVMDIVKFHHEFENTTGYPYKATWMHRETKIVSIIDKYDAICSNRCYKAKRTPREAIATIEELKGRYIDVDEIVEALKNVIVGIQALYI